MGITVAAASRTAMAIALRDLFDGGVGDGYAELMKADNTVLATVTFAAISFTEATGVLTMAGAPLASAAAVAAGAASKFRIYNSTATQYVEGLIGPTDGAHDGAANVAELTDTTANWPVNALVGLTLNNDTDGSSTVVTANTANTAAGVLSGGIDNDWDPVDAYSFDVELKLSSLSIAVSEVVTVTSLTLTVPAS